jgi:hypothetical protein
VSDTDTDTCRTCLIREVSVLHSFFQFLLPTRVPLFYFLQLLHKLWVSFVMNTISFRVSFFLFASSTLVLRVICTLYPYFFSINWKPRPTFSECMKKIYNVKSLKNLTNNIKVTGIFFYYIGKKLDLTKIPQKWCFFVSTRRWQLVEFKITTAY